MYRKIIVSLAFLALTACSKVSFNGMSIVGKDDIALIKKGVSQEEILNILGTPSIVSQNFPNVWYYVHIKTKRSPLTLPKTEEQKIIKITFGQKNKVQDLEILTNTHKDINTNSDYTPLIAQKGMLENFLHNIENLTILPSGIR